VAGLVEQAVADQLEPVRVRGLKSVGDNVGSDRRDQADAGRDDNRPQWRRGKLGESCRDKRTNEHHDEPEREQQATPYAHVHSLRPANSPTRRSPPAPAVDVGGG
jgi:hypothetical protein